MLKDLLFSSLSLIAYYGSKNVCVQMVLITILEMRIVFYFIKIYTETCFTISVYALLKWEDRWHEKPFSLTRFNCQNF